MENNVLRYDRQLRLWANSGQCNLENSSICLINATVSGVEALKNLVLPGVGRFTIIDDKSTTAEDVSSNFFLSASDVGLPKSEALVNNLCELNEMVHGEAITLSLDQILSNDDSKFWDNFNFVLISDMINQKLISQLTLILWEKNIPLMIMNCIGFYGHIRLVMKETTVVETHNTANFFDLRIEYPWDELKHYVDKFEHGNNDISMHSEIPYLVVLIQALRDWKKEHNNKPPGNFKEKKLFKDFVASMSMDIMKEANFSEAINSTHRAFQTSGVPSSIQTLFESPELNQIDSSTNMFWIYVLALKRFVEKYEFLPLAGSIPDMASSTKNYVQLKEIYNKKANLDRKLFTEEVNFILVSLGRHEVKPESPSIKAFCKNSHFLHVTRGSQREYNEYMLQVLSNGSSANEESLFLNIYFCMLSFNSLSEATAKNISTENYSIFIDLLKSKYCVSVKNEKHSELILTIKELLSHNSRNYHNICSFMGGVASQEILKITTRQYIPLDNLFIFDGVNSTSARFKI